MNQLNGQEIQDERNKLKEWKQYKQSIKRVYTFNRFLDGIHFVNQLAQIAERRNHHPDITVQYKTVSITLTTHDAGGLTKLDMESAQEYDQTFERL